MKLLTWCRISLFIEEFVVERVSICKMCPVTRAITTPSDHANKMIIQLNELQKAYQQIIEKQKRPIFIPREKDTAPSRENINRLLVTLRLQLRRSIHLTNPKIRLQVLDRDTASTQQNNMAAFIKLLS